MAETLKFELVSPERKLASVEAEAVTIPGMLGDLTAMANHAPFLTNLRPGYVVVRNGSSEDGYFVTGGFAEISENTVSVLAEEAVEKAEVNRAFIEQKISQAEQALADAAPARKQAALQKLNDYKALLGQVPG
ncbi:MAG: ATP synthase F1 subunit epsilon [Planctomycetes bacterium]|nr:ATP synthase F1 subunit epsilon [Planctomycetota bacterium]